MVKLFLTLFAAFTFTAHAESSSVEYDYERLSGKKKNIVGPMIVTPGSNRAVVIGETIYSVQNGSVIVQQRGRPSSQTTVYGSYGTLALYAVNGATFYLTENSLNRVDEYGNSTFVSRARLTSTPFAIDDKIFYCTTEGFERVDRDGRNMQSFRYPNAKNFTAFGEYLHFQTDEGGFRVKLNGSLVERFDGPPGKGTIAGGVTKEDIKNGVKVNDPRDGATPAR